MAMLDREEHELHRRRRGRNIALGGLLLAFALLTFGVTVAKLSDSAVLAEMNGAQSK